jgi:hypothetical protein
MTIAGPETAGMPEEPHAGGRRYHISLSRLDEMNRSAAHLIHDRLTEACPSHSQPVAGLVPAALIREIQEFHADTEDFIRADMPIQEIVFRTLLARGNAPMSLGEIHRELTQRWGSTLRPISIDQNRLRRVLNSDTYYGFAEA